MSHGNDSGSRRDESRELFTLRQIEVLGRGDARTLRGQIEAGHLPTRIREGVYWLYLNEVEALAVPDSAGESLREWAKRMAETAPPPNPEQVYIIVAAFASALRGGSDE